MIISSLSFDAGGIPLVRVSPLVSKTDYMNIMEAYTKYLIEEPSRFIQNELIPKAVKVPTISKFVQSSLVKQEYRWKAKKNV